MKNKAEKIIRQREKHTMTKRRMTGKQIKKAFNEGWNLKNGNYPLLSVIVRQSSTEGEGEAAEELSSRIFGIVATATKEAIQELSDKYPEIQGQTKLPEIETPPDLYKDLAARVSEILNNQEPTIWDIMRENLHYSVIDAEVYGIPIKEKLHATDEDLQLFAESETEERTGLFPESQGAETIHATTIKDAAALDLMATQNEIAPLGFNPYATNRMFEKMRNMFLSPNGELTPGHSEKVEQRIEKNKLIQTITNRTEVLTFSVTNPAETFGTRRNGLVIVRLFDYVLRKGIEQNFPEKILIHLPDMVNKGMYKSVDAAANALKDFQRKMQNIDIDKRERKTNKKEAGGILFYGRSRNNNVFTIFANPNMPWRNLASQYIYMPDWTDRLNDNAYILVSCIFYYARVNADDISKQGYFNLGLETIRQNMYLPTVEEAKAQNYKQKELIRDKIEKSIDEILTCKDKVSPTDWSGFDIEYHTNEETADINYWLQGYIRVYLNGDYSDKLTNIGNKRRQFQAEAAARAAEKNKKYREAQEAKKKK